VTERREIMVKTNYFMRRVIARFMAAALIVSGMVATSYMVEAAGADAENQAVEEANLSENSAVVYLDRTSEFAACWAEKRAPEQDGYVFGGWFVKNDGVYSAVETEPGSGVIVYAKFVPAHVLSVKAQLKYGGSVGDGLATSMRIVSAVDSSNYAATGFDIEIVKADGSRIALPEQDLQKVYTGLDVYDDKGTLKSSVTPKKLFGEAATYLSVRRLDKVSDGYDFLTMDIKPYWITLDGTKVYGLEKYVHVVDGYNGYISVPVNLYNAKDVAAGMLTMTYDSNTLELADVESAVELDGVFPANEMAYYDDGKGTIKFVGNAESVGLSGVAEGIYANVRFVLKDNATYAGAGSGQFLKFNVTQEEFCDWNEESVEVNAWNIQY